METSLLLHSMLSLILLLLLLLLHLLLFLRTLSHLPTLVVTLHAMPLQTPLITLHLHKLVLHFQANPGLHQPYLFLYPHQFLLLITQPGTSFTPCFCFDLHSHMSMLTNNILGARTTTTQTIQYPTLNALICGSKMVSKKEISLLLLLMASIDIKQLISRQTEHY